jgi:hypothetical protein
MEETQFPTRDQIEALTAFLPRLYAAGFSPIESWAGGEKLKDGSITMPYPNYNPLVHEFFHAVSSGDWLDTAYIPEQAYQMLQNENLIRNASLDQIKTLLTFCVRGERFADGHWAEMIEKGYIRLLLERLQEIKTQQFK